MTGEQLSRERPVVASYCATFLKPEMLHIYRQITTLRRVRPIVIARKRENDFPFEPVFLVRRPAAQFLRRAWYRQLRNVPWLMARREARRVIQVLDRERAALLHVYFGQMAVHLRPVIESWTRPTVVSFHGADVGVDLHQEKFQSALRGTLSSVRLILVRSESLRAALIALGVRPEKIELQRTGIPLAEFPFRQRKPPEDGQWQIVQACRLIPKKGLATSLRAFDNFRKTFPRARLTIAGEGPLLDELKAQAGALGILYAVEFAGFLDQSRLRTLFERSHLFLHPSETGSDGNQEGVPNAMLEAMATGLPVVATRHGGIPEAVQDGINGSLMPESDAIGLSTALTEIAQVPGRLEEMGRAAARSVAEKFDRAAQTERLEELYLRTIAQS